MNLSELIIEVYDAARDGLQALVKLGFRAAIAAVMLPILIFVSLSGEERIVALCFLGLAVGIGLFLRVRHLRNRDPEQGLRITR